MPAWSLLLAFYFVHPAIAAVGLAAASVPILLHLWNRRQPRRVPWAAMEFLRRAYRRTSRRMRLEHLLLLAARVGVIAFATLGLSRPMTGDWLRLGRINQRILLIDNSRSMGQRLPQQCALDRARQLAKDLVHSAQAGDTFAVITLGEPARLVTSTIAGNRQEVINALDRIRLSLAAADLDGGLSLAARVASEWKSTPGTCEAVLLSATTGRAWSSGTSGQQAGASPGRELAQHAQLTLAQFRSSEPQNAAITSVECLDRVVSTYWPASFKLELANYSDRPMLNAAVDVLVNRRLVQTLSVDQVAPQSVIARVFEQKFAAPGQYLLELELHPIPADALAEDDRRPLALEVVDRIRVLIVSGGAPDDSLQGPTYLAAALGASTSGTKRPADSRPGLFAARITTATDLPREPLAGYEFVILQDVPALPESEWRRLREFVSAGHGLLIFAGPHVQPDHYNKYRITKESGAVPARLSLGDRNPSPEAGVSFARPQLDQPAMADLAGSPQTGFFQARVQNYLGATELDSQAAVPLRYTTGEPALIERPLGAGRVLLFTTSADMSWTNLPALGDFVSLVLALAQELSTDRNAWRNVSGAEALRVPLAPEEARVPVILRLPGGDAVAMKTRSGDGSNEAAGAWEAVSDAGEVQGFYEAHLARRDVVLARQGAATESDLRRPSVASVQSRFGCAVTLVDAVQPLPRMEALPGANVSSPLLVAAGLLLLFETWLASALRRREARFRVPSRRPAVAAGGVE